MHGIWGWLFVLGCLFVVVLGEYGKIGNCDRSEFFDRNRQCQLNFFVEIKKDPLGNCNTKYLLMVDCSKNVIKQCLEGTASGEQLSRLVDTTLGMVLAMGEAETMFCRQGGLPLTTITKAPMSQDKPCADRYYRQTPKCGDTFVEKFSVNPADETLCVEYGKVIDCAKHKIEDHCTRSEARDLRNSLYEDFNPYCEADKIIAREVAQNSTGRSSPTSLLYWFCCVILMALYGH